MKKLLSFCTVILLLMTVIPTNVFAETNKIPTQKVVYDTEQLSEKSFSPQKIDNNNSVSPFVAVLPGDGGGDYCYWTANIKIYSIIGGVEATSDSYLDSSKAQRKSIDHIAVRVREYVDGALVKSSTDSQYNLSHAGITVDYGTKYLFCDVEGFGNHTFEERGYQSWYPETYTT